VAAGQNVIQVGEDVRQGEAVLPAGHVVRPQDIGGLLALGIVEVEVAARPRVAILSQGDEVVPPEQEPGPGQVRDINSHTLAALARQAGAEAITRYGTNLPDETVESVMRNRIGLKGPTATGIGAFSAATLAVRGPSSQLNLFVLSRMR
jgi:molybdopterin biosynthesis enzyme